MSNNTAVIKQSPFKSLVFWGQVITSVAGVVYLVVTPDAATVIKAAVAAILAIFGAFAAANNATNPDGFGANKIK